MRVSLVYACVAMLIQEKEMVLKEVTDQAASLLRNLQVEQEEEV